MSIFRAVMGHWTSHGGVLLPPRDTCASDGGKLVRRSRMDLVAWTPRALSVLRIVTGLLFLEHGTGKLLGFPPSDHAASTLFSLIGVQGVLELVGGFLILTGLFTRPAAFILAGDMAVAYFMAHAPKSFFPTNQRRSARHIVLLRLPLLGVCRWWDMECRRTVSALACTLIRPGPERCRLLCSDLHACGLLAAYVKFVGQRLGYG